jgi:hypothetical protein
MRVFLVRQSRNTAASGWPSREAYWSMIPVGAPTTSFSARCPARASSGMLRSRPQREASAPATAISRAAEEESPPPAGTVESTYSSAPGCSGRA